MEETEHMETRKNTSYSLLIRSEETGLGIVETTVYALLALSVMVSILQFAQSPMTAFTIQTDEISRVSEHQLDARTNRKS